MTDVADSTLDPEVSAALDRGSRFLHAGKFAEAVAEFAPLRDRCTDFQYYLNYAEALGRGQRFEEAIEMVNLAIARRPDDPSALVRRSRYYEWNRQLGDAIADLGQVLQMLPHDHYLYDRMGTMLHAVNKLDAAKIAYYQAVKLQPQEPRYYYNLAITLCGLGENADAEASIRKALEANPEKEDYVVVLGHALVEQGKGQVCATELGEKVAAGIDNSMIRYNLARGHLIAGDKGRAADHLRKAVALDPDNARAVDLLENLGA